MNFLSFILFLILITGSSSTRSINLIPDNNLYIVKNNTALTFNINNIVADDEDFPLNLDSSDETEGISIDKSNNSSSYYEITCFGIPNNYFLDPLYLDIPPPSCS